MFSLEYFDLNCLLLSLALLDGGRSIKRQDLLWIMVNDAFVFPGSKNMLLESKVLKIKVKTEIIVRKYYNVEHCHLIKLL